MSTSDVRTPKPLKINGIWQFYPELAHRDGEPDPPPLGPFLVWGDCKVERPGYDVPILRFLVLKPEKGCTLPTYDEYAVEYPEKLIAGDLVTFERKGSAHRIRATLTPPEKGFKMAQLHLRSHLLPVHEYVLYEEQVEGTWIPIEADGQELRP